jgi:hypothetical protein
LGYDFRLFGDERSGVEDWYDASEKETWLAERSKPHVVYLDTTVDRITNIRRGK